MEHPTNICAATLVETIAKVEASTLCNKRALANLLRDAMEVDRTITPSLYGDKADDTPPTGDDYNRLWDVILDYVDLRLAEG